MLHSARIYFYIAFVQNCAFRRERSCRLHGHPSRRWIGMEFCFQTLPGKQCGERESHSPLFVDVHTRVVDFGKVRLSADFLIEISSVIAFLSFRLECWKCAWIRPLDSARKTLSTWSKLLPKIRLVASWLSISCVKNGRKWRKCKAQNFLLLGRIQFE